MRRVEQTKNKGISKVKVKKIKTYNTPSSCKTQENYAIAPYSYVGPTSPWSWSYPCYY
jgi:hypothetical protein